MVEKIIQIELGDERASEIAEIIGNKTCKKILGLLAEKELTETEISKELKIALNTIDYNIKKMQKAGLIEEKSHFWSVKGKRMPVFVVSNKKIVISPVKRVGVKAVIPTVLIAGLGAVAIRFWLGGKAVVSRGVDFAESGGAAVMSAAKPVGQIPENSFGLIQSISNLPSWAWFAIGAGFALVLYLILTKFLGRKK